MYLYFIYNIIITKIITRDTMSNFSSLYGNVCNYSFSNRYSSSLWSRFQPPDYNTATFTPDQINERRKCEILKYKSNTTQTTKKQRFAAASKGSLLKKRGFASQTDTLTVANAANLPEVNGVFICPTSEKKMHTHHGKRRPWTSKATLPGRKCTSLQPRSRIRVQIGSSSKVSNSHHRAYCSKQC